MLDSPLHLNAKSVGDISGQGNKLVIAPPEGAVEFRVPQVQLQTGVSDFSKREAVHLVPGRPRIRVVLAAAYVSGNRDAIRQIQADSAAQSLKEILVQQARADQGGVERGQIAQVVVIEVEGKQGNRLKSNAGKTLRQAGAVGSPSDRCARLINLQRIVNGKSAAYRNRIFGESEFARDMPGNAGHRQPECVIEPQVLEVPFLVVHEGPGDMLVWGVAPGGWVRRGSAKNACSQVTGDAVAEVRSVNRAQTWRIRQIEASDTHRDDGIWILIIKTQMIG